MKIFRWKNQEQKELHPLVVKVLESINGGLKVWAARLQQTTNRYSNKKIKILLLVFSAVFLSESIRIVCLGFKKEKDSFFYITPVHSVPLLNEPSSGPVLTDGEFNRIHFLKTRLDSLQNSACGQLKLDSLLEEYPGIRDSINYLETIYYEQQSNRK